MKKRMGLQAKCAVGFLVFSAILITGISYLFYKDQEDLIVDFYDQKVQAVTQIAADQVDGQAALDSLSQGSYTAEFQDSMDMMDVVKAQGGAKYLYLFTTQNGEGYTYLYTAFVEGDDPADMLDLGEFQPYEGGSAVTDLVTETGKPSTTETYHSDWGYIANAFAPVFDDNGNVIAMVGADYDMNEILDQVATSVWETASVVALFIFAMVLLCLWAVNRIMVRPLRKLTLAASEFVDHSRTTGELTYQDVDIKNRDEIGELSTTITNMTQDLQAYVAELGTVTAEKERIETELTVATNIQQMFLPKIFPPYIECDGLDLFATMAAAKEVGGDFYDFYPIDDDHFCVTVADVSGKGVPAALFMVVAKTVLKNLALAGHSPAEILELANNQLADNNDENMFVTTFLGILEISTGKFVYGNAGHNLPLWYHKGGEVEWLTSNIHLFLAAMGGLPYTQSEIMLQPGDRLLLYTDGVSEAMNPEGELYDDPRLLAFAQKWLPRGEDTVKSQVEELLADLRRHARGADQSDDITILEMEYYGR